MANGDWINDVSIKGNNILWETKYYTDDIEICTLNIIIGHSGLNFFLCFLPKFEEIEAIYWKGFNTKIHRNGSISIYCLLESLFGKIKVVFIRKTECTSFKKLKEKRGGGKWTKMKEG